MTRSETETVAATIDREACVLSGGDFDAIVDALGDQREIIVQLMGELDARRMGLASNSAEEFELLARLSTSVLTVSKTINHPRGKVKS